jgi:Skp family chaperone for outer membrane proteins
LKNTDYNDLLNEITRRMHGYDELAKIFQMNNVALENKLKEIFEKHPEILGEMKENLLNKEVKKDNKIKENKKEKLKKEKKKEK